MMRTIMLATLSAAFTLATAALAQDEPKKDDPDQIVCKSQKKTGTRFATKVCHTRRQWNAIAEANKREYGEARDRPTVDISRGT